MGHHLILGMTKSGKGNLCKLHLIPSYHKLGTPCLVLDPLHYPDWNADFQTHKTQKFLETVWANERCAVFVDEAGDTVGQYDKIMQQLATKGRHWGHNCHFLTQRGAQVAQTLRDQCDYVWLFRVSAKDSKTLAEEFTEPKLEEAYTLRRGECFVLERFGVWQKVDIYGKNRWKETPKRMREDYLDTGMETVETGDHYEEDENEESIENN